MTVALEGGEWSAARPGRTLPPGKTRYPYYRTLGGPQGRSGQVENLIPTWVWSQTVQLVVSHYTDWATWLTKEVYTVSKNTTNSFHIGWLIASADFIQFGHHETIIFYKYHSLQVTSRYIVQAFLRHVTNKKTCHLLHLILQSNTCYFLQMTFHWCIFYGGLRSE